MKHASEFDLALYAGKELKLPARWRVGLHLRGCSECRRQLEDFRAARAQLREASSSLPDTLDWDRLASEMKANIHLGLSAGECVAGPASSAPRSAQITGWRPAAVFAGAILVVAMAWYANFRTPLIPTNLVSQNVEKTGLAAAVDQGVQLETSRSAIKVNDNGRMMSLRHPEDRDVVFSVSLQGSVRARFVDSESGQVTINNAYVQ